MNELPEIVRFLLALPGFDALDHPLIARAAASIKVAYYRTGDDILRIGSSNDQLHIVRSGAIELQNEDGDLVMRAAEGDCFGFPSLMNAAPVRNHSIAIEDSLVYHMEGDVFANLRQSCIEFDTFFIRALSDRLLARPANTSISGVTDQTIGQLVTRGPVTIDSTVSVRETAKKMLDERVSAMLITDNGNFCGIVTDRDIRIRVVAEGLPADAEVRDIMTTSPISIDADSLAYEAALTMMQNRVHHLPITSNDELIGMVSRSDFMRLANAQ